MPTFPLCLNTSTIRPISLLDKINIAGLVGFDAIELWTDDLDAHIRQGGTLKDVKTALSESGLSLASVIALFGWTESQPSVQSRVRDECRRRMDQAAQLGSRTIVASPPAEVVEVRHAAECYHALCDLGLSMGLPVSLEFLGFVDGIKTLSTARAIVEASGVRGGTVVADVYHLLRGGGSLDDLLACEGKDLSIFHINDLPAYPPVETQEDGDRVMLGDGIVDLPHVVGNLRTIGYAGPLSLELFNMMLWIQDPLDVCRRGMERLRELTQPA